MGNNGKRFEVIEMGKEAIERSKSGKGLTGNK